MAFDPKNWLWWLEGKLLGLWRVFSRGTLLTDATGDSPHIPALNMVAPLQAVLNTAEGRFDLSIEPSALIPSVPTARTAYVDDLSGHDSGPEVGQVGQRTFPFATPGAALTAVDSMTPSSSNPFTVLIHPGVYPSDPLDVSPWVTLASVGGPGTVTILASDPAAPLITGQAGSFIGGLTLAGAAAPGGIGILTTGGGQCTVQGCVITSCETLARATGTTAALFLQTFGGFTDSATANGAEAVSGGSLTLVDATITGQSGSLITGAAVRCDGAGSEVLIAGPLAARYASAGIVASSDGVLVGTAVQVRHCNVGLHIPASSGSIELVASAVIDSTAEDVLVESTTARLVTSGFWHEKPLNIVAGADIFGSRLDRTRGVVVQEGRLCVGAPDRPGVLSAGEGCPTTQGMVAFTFDGITWVDVTAELSSPAGSPISVVPGLGLGNYLYIGTDFPHTGLELDVMLVQTGGTLTPEYWAAGWQTFDWMTAEAVPPHTASGNALFAATGLQDMRFGAQPGRTTSIENGVTKFWTRIGVTVALTTSPRIERAKWHASYFKSGPDGTLLFYGDSRPTVYADLDLNIWAAGGTAGNDSTTSYSPNVTRGRLGADFVNNSTRDMGYRWPLARDFDTSTEADLLVRWSPSTTNGGTMTLTKHHIIVPPDSLLDGTLPGEVSLAADETPSGTANKEQIIAYPIVIPTAIAGVDSLAMTLIRAGGSDAFTGTARLEKVTLRYRAWRL